MSPFKSKGTQNSVELKTASTVAIICTCRSGSCSNVLICSFCLLSGIEYPYHYNTSIIPSLHSVCLQAWLQTCLILNSIIMCISIVLSSISESIIPLSRSISYPGAPSSMEFTLTHTGKTLLDFLLRRFGTCYWLKVSLFLKNRLRVCSKSNTGRRESTVHPELYSEGRYSHLLKIITFRDKNTMPAAFCKDIRQRAEVISLL